jgi:hypothetical protein
MASFPRHSGPATSRNRRISAEDDNTTAENLFGDEFVEGLVDPPANEVFMVAAPNFPIKFGGQFDSTPHCFFRTVLFETSNKPAPAVAERVWLPLPQTGTSETAGNIGAANFQQVQVELKFSPAKKPSTTSDQ